MSDSKRPRGAPHDTEREIPALDVGALPGSETLPFGSNRVPNDLAVQRFRLVVVDGPDRGRAWDSEADRCSVGSHPSNDFIVEDGTVSRFHCELSVGPKGPRVKDLDSKNGTVVDGVRVVDAYVKGGSLLQLGRVSLRFELQSERNTLPISDKTEFGAMVGASVAMRQCFALMEKAARSDATVLIEGETGTGKSRAAQAIHEAGARKGRPFLVVDCGAIPGNLLESELFGHEKGAFTGALSRRVGAFEEAGGGTVFLDEIGELPAELQPKLLRVIESREIRRLGTNAFTPVDVRVIAATNRDLRAEVNAGRFRSDLFFRLAVVKLTLPPLRQRPEDIPPIVEGLLAALGARGEVAAPLRSPEFMAKLSRAAWPGNIRELRNHIERCLVLEDALPPVDEAGAQQLQAGPELDPSVPYAEARRRALDAFERAYVSALLFAHQGKVSQAATASDVDRVYLYRLMRRHGLKPASN